MTGEWALLLRGYGVAFGDQVVLASIDLDVPATGIVTLVGSAGSGKSTLLRTLAGCNDAQPELQTWGTATFRGEPLGRRRPALVQQHARLLTATVRENLVSALGDRAKLTKPAQSALIRDALERYGLGELAAKLSESVIGLSTVEQRLIATARAALTGSPLLLIDEPTAQLPDEEGRRITDLIAELARGRAVLLVTHDQRVARRTGGRVSLLAGGRILETRSSDSFFERPTSTQARAFVRTGRCSVPSPNARPEDLSTSRPPPPPLPPEARAAVSRSVGPRGFHWLVPGTLGGLPRPGIVSDLKHDIAGLRRLGITRLVTLEETETVPAEVLAAHSIARWHFPVVDMEAPEIPATVEFCELVNRWMSSGEVVALHCRAGLGRTGTMLAAQLIWAGTSALDALERARAINPRWVQSDEQVHFLTRFERWMTVERGGSAATPH